MTAQDNPSSKPPVTPDASQIFNRIALATAKHERILSTLSKHRATATSTITSSLTTNTGSGSGGFSSLTSRTTTPSNAVQPQTHDRPTRNPQDDADLLYSHPPNAGIGYSPSPSPSSSSSVGSAVTQDRETMALRRKVLGRNAARQLAEREQQQRNGRKRGLGGGGGAGESESEEEVGRGALVRSRGIKGRGRVEEVETGQRKGGKSGGASSVTARNGRQGKGSGDEGGGKDEEDEVMPKRKKARVDEREAGMTGLAEEDRRSGEDDAVMAETGSAVEGQAAGEKKRKKKNKKKKKKGGDGKAEVEVGVGAGSEAE